MTARDRAALRDAAARSLLEYDEWKKERRQQMKLFPPPAVPDAFFVAGDIAEHVTVLEALASDIDDAELSRAVAALRSHTTRVGNLLARRRRAYSEGVAP